MMARELISVMLCCNDEQGRMSGRLWACHTDEIELASQYADWGPKLVFLEGAVRIGGKRFTHHGRGSWVGNIFWEAVSMEMEEFCRLLNWPRFRRWFDIEAGPCVIVDAWDKRREITVEMVKGGRGGTR
jgi:hypothetical protein